MRMGNGDKSAGIAGAPGDFGSGFLSVDRVKVRGLGGREIGGQADR